MCNPRFEPYCTEVSPSTFTWLGMIAKGVGELALAVLAQVADMERKRILGRTASRQGHG